MSNAIGLSVPHPPVELVNLQVLVKDVIVHTDSRITKVIMLIIYQICTGPTYMGSSKFSGMLA